MSSKANYKVYMDFQIGASGAGRVVFELFNDLTSKTSQNFRGLCTGQHGKSNNHKLHYHGTKIHKIIDGFVLQGGDISNTGGKGGYSIFGRTFADESFARTHSCAGLLSMVNSGRNTNASQFYITLKQCPHLDGKNVVFGQVIDGMEIIRKISKVPIGKEDKPKYPIVIIDCGEVGDFKSFLKYDPFKKEVFQEIRLKREAIIHDQHMIRKLLSEGVDPNEAYQYKKKLEVCEKDLAALDKSYRLEEDRKRREEDGEEQYQQREVQPISEKVVITQKMKQRMGQSNVNLLLDLKLKINQAKVLNSRAALDEEIRQNDVNYHKMIKKQEWNEKRQHAENELEAKGLSKQKLYLNRNALKKEKEDKGIEHISWNVYGEEAYYKAYDRRCQHLQKDDEYYLEQKELGYSKNQIKEEALNRLSEDIIKQQQNRSSFSRRRVFDEAEQVTYINDRNRIYNQKLQRNFGQYSSSTKTALEMNSQK